MDEVVMAVLSQKESNQNRLLEGVKARIIPQTNSITV
jgi:hypothetical protein